MRVLIKLLLLAALVAPTWTTAAAQTQAKKKPAPTERTGLSVPTGQGAKKSLPAAKAATAVAEASYAAVQETAADFSRAASATQPNVVSSNSAQKHRVTKAGAAAQQVRHHSKSRAVKHPKPALSERSRTGEVIPDKENTGRKQAPPRRATAVSLPDGATVENWTISTDWYYYTSSGWTAADDYNETVQVAFVGNDVYIAGLCYWIPDAWVKGTLSGTTVTFSSGQYYGADDGDDIYFVGTNSSGTVSNVVFTYNATAGTLTQSSPTYIRDATTADYQGSYSYHTNVVLTRPAEVLPTADLYSNGTGYNEYVPMYGYYFDTNTSSQMIYPQADLLAAGLKQNDKIKAITFYTNTSNGSSSYQTATVPAQLGTAVVQVHVGNTETTTISSYAEMATNRSANMTKVYEGYLTTGSNTMTITFDSPFEYTGKNLMIGTYDLTPGGSSSNYYAHCYWAGTSATSGASYYGYSSTGSAAQAFLPKMTITYEEGTPSVPYAATLEGDGDFGDVYKGNSVTTTFTVTNEGTQAFTPVLTITGAGAAAYTVSGDQSTQLAAGQSRDFTITFHPTAVDEYIATLTLSASESAASAISATATLTGYGSSEVTVADGSDLNGYVPVYLYYLDYTNHGQIIYPASVLNGKLRNGDVISSITFYANGNLVPRSSTASNDPSTIELKLGETTSASYGSSTTFITSGLTSVATIDNILTGDDYVTILFSTPYTYHGGNLVVDAATTSVGGQYTESSLNWLGVTSTGASLHEYGTTYGVSQRNFLPKVSFGLDAQSVDKDALDFGNVAVGTTSAPQTVTVANNGEAMTVSWTFSNNAFSTTATTPTTIGQGQEVEIPVTFTPTAAGEQTGTLDITVGEDVFVVDLRGNGLQDYAATVAPQSVDFGAVSVNGTATATVTLTNTGYNAISPTFTQPAQTAFTVSGATSALASGESREFTITFHPTAEQTYSGEFTITAGGQSFTVTLTGQGAPMDPVTANPETLDFGAVDVGSTRTLSTTLSNSNANAVKLTLSVTAPYTIGSTEVTVPANGTATVSVTFTPTAANSYSGTLTGTIQGVNTVVKLKGVGNINGSPAAIRDKDFFEGITYKWPITTETNESTMDEIATDPDQIIALLRAVYMNKDIPGNYQRGYTTSGGSEGLDDVYYSGVGTLIDDNNTIKYNDGYGWNIPGTVKTFESTYSNYGVQAFYMDTTQYKPNQEGLTLILLEMTDDFDKSNVNGKTTNYSTLREYFTKSVKSARVLTEAKRTGSGFNAGTLFKIDCDKMNKFFIIAKGQLRQFHESQSAFYDYYRQYYSLSLYNYFGDICAPPCYVYCYDSYYGSTYIDKYCEDYSWPLFYHMYEQFSPVTDNATAAKSDIYQDLVNMESFSVMHDCMTVSGMGHQFMMYGSQSNVEDCQDVRDLMFFVPDYRMMYYKNLEFNDSILSRDALNNDYIYQKFRNYHPEHAPTMGLYVIRQDPVTATVKADDYYKLTLTWDSNMDEFLPGEQQEYNLLELVTDEFGNSSYVPVYYTNANGEYTDANGNVLPNQKDSASWVAVVLTLNPSSAKKTYTNVYVQRESGSKTVTYAIQGRDTGHFLNLQVSNEESYLIPGKDPAEMAVLSNVTYYSRYNPQTENNCYSNRMVMSSNPNSILSSYVTTGTVFNIVRRTAADATPVTVATATVTSKTSTGGTLRVNMLNQAAKTEFPAGMSDNPVVYYAGYHANTGGEGNCNWTHSFTISNGYVNIENLKVYDNFVEDVSENAHPNQYLYKVEFTTATPFTGLDGSTSTAYSNTFRVPVYKTITDMDGILTEIEVRGDVRKDPALSPADPAFKSQVQYSSKTEILRYDAYRWASTNHSDYHIVDKVRANDDEDDLAPTGIAGNQGESYTVSMNAVGTADYYTTIVDGLSTDNSKKWARFVDLYPQKADVAGVYTYAPVIELFTRGVDHVGTARRTDYNTYGGPMQHYAVGKLSVKLAEGLGQTEENAFMSKHMWTGDEGTYAYYNIPLEFTALDLPEGYELYKVRAWRVMDNPSLLGEELASRQERIDAENLYLYEEMNFGDNIDEYGIAGEDRGMTLSKLQPERSYQLGGRLTGNKFGPVDEGQYVDGNHETMATFGARRLETNDYTAGCINELKATFYVRAYFTPTDNPAVIGTGSTQYAPIYVLGNGTKSTSWNPTIALGTLYSTDGTTYTGKVTINDTNDPRTGQSGNYSDVGFGYFSLATALATENTTAGWNSILNNRYGWNDNDNYWVNSVPAENLELKAAKTGSFRIAAGTYKLTVTATQSNGKPVPSSMTIVADTSTPKLNANRDGSAANYDYYVAEGSVRFDSNQFGEIITGVTGVKMDQNREAIGVQYVNAIGQVSSTPWQGVNIVVTRYSDGSTTTQKMVK